MSTRDFALSRRKNDWSQHPVLGDPSFDSFRRRRGNPIYRGRPGMEWPVNGFLFEDPATSHWYVYVGHYARNYDMGADKSSVCTVSRSTNRGRTWEHLGPVFPHEPFRFNGLSSPVAYAPDVSVVFDGGRYHMAYDWATADTDWVTSRSDRTGVGYAWSDRPQGPFHRSLVPLLRNGGRPRDALLRNKYNRYYASTLIRRRDDWLLLTIVDSRRYYGWGLVGATARNPDGPYSEPWLLFHVDGDTYQPPLMEYFPSFVHDGWVYAPATSVAINRNFQIIHRAPIEQAVNPAAWELHQHGSVWHSEPAEHEAWGLWGQAFSGFVDERRRFHVMFPSKDRKDRGTINLAERGWDRPWTTRGFHLSGHEGPSLSVLRRNWETFRLESELEFSGAVSLLWAHNGPLGPDTPKSNATLHERCITRCRGLRLTAETWEVFEVGELPGERKSLARGRCSQPSRHVAVECAQDGHHRVLLNTRGVWRGALPAVRGAIGLLAERHSCVAVRRFRITGPPRWAAMALLYTEALVGAGQNLEHWDEVDSPLFRFSRGAVHRGKGGRAKWNFRGTGFALWAPRGPEYGKVEVRLDGKAVGSVNLRARVPRLSEPVLHADGLADTFHAVVAVGRTGRLVVDSLDACTSVSK